MSAYICTGAQYAAQAYSYRDSGYTYDQYDCIHFVNLVNSDIGLNLLINGTNSSWRNDQDMFSWSGTLTECVHRFQQIPDGALLWRCIPEGEPGYETIPPQYYGDGIGNITHIGIRCYTAGTLTGGVMQSGGYGGTGVHYAPWATSNFNWWSYVSLLKQVRYGGGVFDLTWLYMWLRSQQRRPAKNVKYRL